MIRPKGKLNLPKTSHYMYRALVDGHQVVSSMSMGHASARKIHSSILEANMDAFKCDQSKIKIEWVTRL